MTQEDRAEGVAADDRRPGEFPTDYLADVQPTIGKRYRSLRGGQTTVEALRRLWDERDESYANNEKPLTDDQIVAIRAWRVLEVKDLSPQEQVNSGLAVRAMTWTPKR